ncbi:MAG TPA: hypothetical protein VJ463_08190, partial [Geothrix sp.]|nr:hypothetical protein [Geothrix sp.]
MQNLAFALIALAVCAAPPPRPAGPPRHARGSGGAEAPCDAVFEVDFTRTQITGTGPERVTFREHVAIAGTVAGVLTYSEEGVEDFYLGQPSGGGLASEYDFGPEPGTRPRMAYRRDWTRVGPQQPKCEGRVIANKAGYGGFSMSMTTTGRGDLLFTHGGLQFVREGASASETDRNWNIGTEGGKSRIEAESRSSEAGVDEALSCFWAEQRAGANPGHATPDPVFQISRSALHDALASGRPAEVSGKGDYHLTLEDGVILEGTTKVTLKIRPPAIEAILEPADPGYDTWIPEGPPPGGLPRRGNQFGVRVRLVERGHPEKPVKALLHDTVFRFAEVSQQPGDCMNHPRKDPDLGPDLRFE